MRDLVVMAAAAALMVVVVESQQLAGHRVQPAQRRQILDVAPFSHGLPRRPPPPRHRGPPPSGFRGPPPSPHSSGSRPIYHGPPPQENIGPFGPPFDPQQGTGHLPLDPRPNFDNPHFLPEEEINVSGEEALKGGDFSPLFNDDEYTEPAREIDEQRLPSEHLRPPVPRPDSFPPPPQTQDELRHQEPQTQEFTSPQEEHQTGVTELLESQVTPLQEEEPQLQQPPRPRQPHVQSSEAAKKPQQQLQEPPQQLGGEQYEQETKEVVIVSAVRPNHSQSLGPPRPHAQLDARDRRPSHPNQLPLYNVIEENQDTQGAESQERPYRVLYDYEEEEEEEKEDEEEEEPDRLSILLLDSHFSCIDKKNGYYADEEVQCEVFHYCQDRVKHSWLCPQGASFHQVHLICIPRSEDNICEKSSKFHFVNEFLYKELDADSGSNKTYADRYYPVGFEHGLAGVDTDRPVAYPAGVAAPTPYVPTQHVQTQHAPRRPASVYLENLPHTQPQYHEDTADPYVDREVEQFARPHNAGVPQGFSRPVYRGGGQGFGNLEEVLAQRRPG